MVILAEDEAIQAAGSVALGCYSVKSGNMPELVKKISTNYTLNSVPATSSMVP
jgi:hypothetical protein